MIVARSVVTTGLTLSLVLTAVIFVTLWHEPRIWLHDMPHSFQDRVPPKSDREIALTWGYSALFLPLFFGVPIASTIRLLRRNPDLGFWSGFANAAGIVLVFGLVDLVLIDWLVICWITPSFIVVPGTEGAPEYKDYVFHAVGFAIGLPIMATTGIVAAALATWRQRSLD
ncbi:hypothetical protein [Hyphomicrobium sp.]|uniref:hypothetical protein n=1 Tax=Hyphomicrobium sp. TaxID=82 RepID=UPI002CEEAB5C|nr:hypothetical protein [Hyphomicrobium sp.]HRN86993.1 hypothetical protein [Hyphomicrobium sp.]HRQ26653.1 hypothetical protein [Hyphomicrobium sp.]